MLHSINPATNTLLRSFEPLTADALAAKLALAGAAAESYPLVRLDQRIFWMRRLALLLDAETEELAALMTAEMGKTLTAARAEVAKCALCCRYYADHAPALLAPERIATEHAEAHVRYDPLGVVLAVMPWNFPLWQVFRFAAPALIAGNVALLKHAPSMPQCALAIEALIRRAGFPRGSFQTLLLEDTQVESVIADPRVAAITLTGSEAAGQAIAAQAGWFLKKTVLELGGSDAFIVLASADLDKAIPAAVQSRCINNGQSCIAAKRFLVHDALYDEFTRRFTAAMAFLRVGDPTDPATDIGPLASEHALTNLRAQIARATESGGRILTGGGTVHAGGNYIAPTVIVDVPRDAPITQEEIFGPVALVFRITSLDDAITLANATPFGLAASCWTRDPIEQQRLAERLQCGGVFFNTIVASDPRLPFGGIKRSGYGRELAAAGMREFLNAKTIVVSGPQALADQPSLFDEDELIKAVQQTEEQPRFLPRKPQAPLAALDPTPEPVSEAPTDEPVPAPQRGSILGLSR